jgi:AAA+ superfamily predicted ATPase
MASSSLGKSQREVTRLFHEVIPERAAHGPCVVLLDEVETLAADRQRLSLEANPIDVHRATDAALAGIDLLARRARNVLLLATTNFRAAVDRALLSRADWIEEIGPPGEEARRAIIRDSLRTLATRWPEVGRLDQQVPEFARASAGLDGRRLRKAIISAAAASLEAAQDPNKLRAEHVMEVLSGAAAAQAGAAAR